MTRQARSVEAKGLKKNQVPEGKAQHRVETSMTKPYQPDVANNLLIPLTGTAEKPPQPLKVPQLQAIQLQQFAIELGNRQGNRHLASLVQRQAEGDTANNQRLNQVSGEATTETASVQSQAQTNSTEAQSEATTKESELTSQAQANEAQVRGQASADEAQSQAQINAQQSAMESQAGELQAEMQGEYAAGQGEANSQAAMIQAGAQTGERELNTAVEGFSNQAEELWTGQENSYLPKIQEAEKYSEITFAEAEGQVQQILQRGAGEGSSEEGRRIIENAWERVQSFLKPVQEKLESVWGFVNERIDQLWGIVEAQAERLYGVLAAQMDAALSRFEQMAVRVNLRIIRKIDQGMAMAAEVWGRVRSQMQIAFARLSIALSGLLAGLMGRINSVVGALRARVSEMINRLRSGINTAVNRLTGLAQGILSVFGNRVQGVLSRFRAGATGAVNSAANAAQSAWSRLSARGMAAWQSLQVTGTNLITLPLTMGMNKLMMAISRGDRLMSKAQNTWSQVRGMWLNGITATRKSFIMIREGARAVVSSIRGRSFAPIFGWLRSRFGAIEKRVQRLLSRAADTYQNLLRWAEEAAQMGGIREPGFAVPAGTESREAGAREHLPAAAEGHAPERGRGRTGMPEQAGLETVLKPPKSEEEIKPENLAQEKPPKPEAVHIPEKPKGEEPRGGNLSGAIAGTSADQIVTQETKKPMENETDVKEKTPATTGVPVVDQIVAQETKKPAGNETAEKVKAPEPTGAPVVDQIVTQETKKPAGNETAEKVKAPEPTGAPVVDQIVAQETKKPAGNETAEKGKTPEETGAPVVDQIVTQETKKPAGNETAEKGKASEPAGVTAAEQMVNQDAEKQAGKAPVGMEKVPAPAEMKEPDIMIPKPDLWEREKEKLGDER